MKKLSMLMIVCFLVFVLSFTARSEQIFQIDSFTISGGQALVGFQEFDSAWGTLNSVYVSMTGWLEVQTLLGPGMSVTFIVNFDALATGGQGFGFAGTGAQFVFPSVTNSSTSESISTELSAFYSLHFTLTEFTDFSGNIVADTDATSASLTPPTTINAQRADFIQGIAPQGISETFTFSLTTNSSLLLGGGEVSLYYFYTPASETPAQIPEPASVLLLCAGLAALLMFQQSVRGK